MRGVKTLTPMAVDDLRLAWAQNNHAVDVRCRACGANANLPCHDGRVWFIDGDYSFCGQGDCMADGWGVYGYAPWWGSSVDDENRWFNTRVRVLPDPELRGDSEWPGKVVRILNAGSLVEVRPVGMDSTFRIRSERVQIVELVDSLVAESERAA